MFDPLQDPVSRWDLHTEDDSAVDRAHEAQVDRELGVTP